jgi:plastocyanin
MRTDTEQRPTNPLPRRRGPSGWLAVLLLIISLVVVGVTGVGAGNRRAESTAAAPAAPTTAVGAAPSQAVAGHHTTVTTSATKPAKPRLVGTLITRNMGTEQNPDRVYLAVGQTGTHPRFYARPGERIEIGVKNKDTVIHSLTLDPAEVNLDAWAGKLSITKPFLAPKAAGTYQFYCRYQKAGMSGTLVVGGQPVRTR